jgi:dTDP-4-dehydrorhamnose reductase
LYHSVNTGQPCSRFEFAQKILEYAGIASCKTVPVNSAYFPLPAPRPRMEGARNLHLELLNLKLMRPWQEALRDYISNVLVFSPVRQ